jgi:hypothetical protein
VSCEIWLISYVGILLSVVYPMLNVSLTEAGGDVGLKLTAALSGMKRSPRHNTSLEVIPPTLE